MEEIQYTTDRMINSTDTNEYAEGLRDETLLQEDLIDTNIPLTDTIPDGLRETREEDRPLYNEEGYRNNPGE